MIALICFVLAVLASPFKSKSRLEAENAALRDQLIVLRRKMPGRPWLTNNDRWFFLQMYRWFPSILKVVRISLLVPRRERRKLHVSIWLKLRLAKPADFTSVVSRRSLRRSSPKLAPPPSGGVFIVLISHPECPN
jgi:hypothetical protein